MALPEWQIGPGRERNNMPWPSYRPGASSVPHQKYTLTVGNASTVYGHNDSIGSIAPTELNDTVIAELYHDTGTTDSLVLKFAAGAEAATKIRIEMGDEVAELTFNVDQYEGTNTAIAAAILAADGATIVLEIVEIPAA